MSLEIAEFAQAGFLGGLPPFRRIVLEGAVPPKILKFTVTSEGNEAALYFSSVIGRDESLTWKSYSEILQQGIKLAAASLRGLFGFEMLSTDLNEGVRSFKPAEFSQLLVNHGRKLEAGEKALVRYGQMFAVFHKRVDEDWAKIDFRHHVEVFLKETGRFDLHVKSLLRHMPAEGENIAVIHDLGKKPIFQFGNEEQTERLRKLLEKTQVPVYVVTDDHTIELHEQFQT
ncbi:MAG: hypothetical protein Q8R76_08010 [Candidatus Omnitrophota bacterium]|nr:hypothetical protein [Candidatus Omnitrophota bacterium]